MSTPGRDGVSVVLTYHTEATLAPLRAAWDAYRTKCGREFELLTEPAPAGVGAAFRAALDRCRQPLVLLVTDDYPYTPADLDKLLEKVETTGDVPNPRTGELEKRLPEVVCGVRTGVPVPPLPRLVGRLVGGFCKYALGFPLTPLAGWYGVREYLRTWRVWAVYGVPFADPHVGLKLFRRAFLDRVPIQCDGDLVHIELAAKATFLTALVDQAPLTPRPDPVPHAVWTKADRAVLWGKPKFCKPQESLVIGQ